MAKSKASPRWHVVAIVLLGLLTAACDQLSTSPPVVVTIPWPASSPAPSPPPMPPPPKAPTDGVWDTRQHLSEWVDNPLTVGVFSLETVDGVDFVRGEVRFSARFSLHSPAFVPPFKGLRAVRVRMRSAPGSTGRLLSLAANVFPGGPTLADPLVLRHGFAGLDTSFGWQVVDLLVDPGRPDPNVDALWMYLTFGGDGVAVVDIDRIELVR